MATTMQHKIEDYQHRHVNNYNRMDENNPGDVIVGIDAPPQYPQAPLTVAASTMGVQEPTKPFAFDALIVSVVSYVCCCSLLGFFGIIAALLSYSDHRVNDHVSHKSKRNIALGCSIAGIVIGLLTIITIIAVCVSTISAVGRVADSDREFSLDG